MEFFSGEGLDLKFPVGRDAIYQPKEGARLGYGIFLVQFQITVRLLRIRLDIGNVGLISMYLCSS